MNVNGESDVYVVLYSFVSTTGLVISRK